MIVTVHLFAAARDLAGCKSVSVELPNRSTVSTLRTKLATTFPSLSPLLARSAIAVNHDYAEDESMVSEGDELAVIAHGNSGARAVANAGKD